MGIGVLGTLTVDDAPVSLSPRDRVVLSALATRPGQVVSRDRLADALWREDPPASAQKVVQGCVMRLRRLLGAETIQTAPPGYRLAVPEDAVDSVRFERTVARARDLAAVGQTDRAAHLVDEALGLWRGRPLPDVEDWEPGLVESQRLEALRQEAQELRIDAYLRAGRHHQVLADAAALLREAPTREVRWALLARAQYQDGRQAEALATLHRARDLLAERLGIDAGPELDRLQEAMLRQDPSLLPDAHSPAPTARCPYRGLSAYEVGDAETFFGRDREVATCLGLLEQQGALAVVGPSGCGKSSVVRAGVVAALSRSGTRVQVLTPGEAPVRVLEALPRGAKRDAWVVDQCEEVFSLCSDAGQRLEFLDRLVAHAEHGPVVIALRADRLAEVAPYPSFARLVERGLHLLGAMDESALREVVEAPARQAGLILEPGLVDLLVREVEGEPGALPLLSHALQETWLRREANTMTVAGYQATGGIRGAVAQTAETVYGRVDPAQRHLMRELMLRLVSAGTEGEPSRIRAARSRVIVEPAQDRLVDDLVTARLLTSEEGVIEIAHESLARAWPRLRDWLADDVEGQRILHHVTSAADAWDALGRPDSELYRGTRLQQALEWRDQARVELTAVEREFLDTGRQAAEAEEAALAARARHQARMIRRQRVALVAGSVFLVLALAASGVALSQSERAQAGERAAEANERTAQAGRIGARALTVEDPSVALLLAVEAVRIDDNPQTRSYVREAMARRPELVASTEPGESFLLGIAVDGRTDDAIAYGYDNVIYRFDLTTGATLATHDLDEPEVTRSPTFSAGELRRSPDGTVVAVGAQLFTSPAVTLLDAETLRPLRRQPAGQPRRLGRVPGLAFSADGDWLAASFMLIADDEDNPAGVNITGHEVRVWNLSRPSARPRRITLPNTGGSWPRIRLSSDGSTLYTMKPSVAAFAVRTGRARWRRDDLNPPFGSSFDLAPGGQLLAVPAEQSGVRLLDPRNGKERARLSTQGREVANIDFSPSGSRLALQDWSNGLSIVDPTSGDLIHQLQPGIDVSLDYGFDDDVLHVAGDHGIETIELEGGRRFMARTPWQRSAGAFPLFNSLAPGGAVAARHVQHDDELVEVVLASTETGRPLRKVDAGDPGAWEPVGWHPDGSSYAVGSLLGEVSVIPLEGRVRRFAVSDEGIVAVEFTSSGDTLVVLDEGGRLHVLDAATGTASGPPSRVDGVGTDVSLTPEGREALVLLARPPMGPGELDPATTWARVDLERGEVVETGDLPDPGGYFGWQGAAVEPVDGGRVALIGGLGAAIVDLATGERLGPQIAAHTDFTWTGGYSEDGSMVLAGGDDGRVSQWDGATGSLIDVALVDPGGATRVVPRLLPDGHSVVAVTTDAAYRWDTRIEKAVEAACRAAGRSMTEVEWRTNVGEDLPYHATCG